MSMTDPLADMLTRIRNSTKAKKAETSMPSSNLKVAVARVLQQEGFIRDFRVESDDKQGILTIALKYDDDEVPLITGLQRVSKPSRRCYVKGLEAPRVLGGMGIGIITTSKGVMTDRAARANNLGGEYLCRVW